MEIKKVASIDIGSNAVRMLVSNVIFVDGKYIYRKGSLVRLPIRLGADVFKNGKISSTTSSKLLKGMEAYNKIMEINEVVALKACATSAMREAENGKGIVKKIKELAGIDIEIIDGETEAKIIYSTQIAENLDDSEPHLYVDVGGGSTEITLFYKGKARDSYSFNIGTVRMLSGKVKTKHWNELSDWLKKIAEQFDSINLIGSGGNINKIFKLTGVKNGKPLSYVKLYEQYKLLSKYSVEDRIIKLGLNTDRADVIIPAAEIFLTVMKVVNAKQVLVPKVGLPDGLARLAFEEFVQLSK